MNFEKHNGMTNVKGRNGAVTKYLDLGGRK